MSNAQRVEAGMGTGDAQQDGGQDQAARREQRTVAEWTTLAISAAVVLALIGAALAEMFLQDDPSGAVVSIEQAPDEAEVRDGQTYIPYVVRYDGADAAADIVALVEFSQGDQVVEETTIDIAHLASHDVVEGEVVTTLDLAAHTVEGRISVLQRP